MLNLLLRFRLWHLKALVLSGVLLVAAVGGLMFGWKGALAGALLFLLLAALTAHCLVSWMISSGQRAHAEGRFLQATQRLWLLNFEPIRRRYDPSGAAQAAFQASCAQMAGGLLQNALKSLFR